VVSARVAADVADPGQDARGDERADAWTEVSVVPVPFMLPEMVAATSRDLPVELAQPRQTPACHLGAQVGAPAQPRHPYS
jgi:hypothetical protein